MPTYVALLRAVNVGGANALPMSRLRTLLTAAGLTDVETILQSGNVIFRSDVRSIQRLEQTIAKAIEDGHRLAIDVCVRTAADWKALVAANPFPDEARRDPGHLLVLCLSEPVPPASVLTLQQRIAGREQVSGHAGHVYAVYPDGIGRSKLTTAVIERSLGVRVTGRNWNTVLRIADRLGGT